MKSNLSIAFCFVFGILTMLVVGCQNTNSVLQTERIHPETSPSPNVEATTTPTVSVTPLLTPTPVITSTPWPTRSLSPSPTFTWTPLPTLSEEEAKQHIWDLLNDNGGCKLPCWWGAIPGETSWESTEHYLISFFGPIGKSTITDSDENGNDVFLSIYGVEYVLSEEGTKSFTTYVVEKDTIKKIIVKPYGAEIGYSLHQILGVYGMPEEILFLARPYTHDYVPHYYLLLYYPHLGIMAIYEGTPTINGEQIEVCPFEVSAELDLVEPDSITLERMKQTFWSPTTIEYMKPISDATDYSLESFYQAMLEPSSCFETPLEIWDN